MKYKWLTDKRKGKVHLLREDGKTWCKVEHNSPSTIGRLSEASDAIPKGRRLCWLCSNVKAQEEYEETHGKLDAEFRKIMQ